MEAIRFSYVVRRGDDLSVGTKNVVASPGISDRDARCIIAFGLGQAHARGHTTDPQWAGVTADDVFILDGPWR